MARLISGTAPQVPRVLILSLDDNGQAIPQGSEISPCTAVSLKGTPGINPASVTGSTTYRGRIPMTSRGTAIVSFMAPANLCREIAPEKLG